MRQSRTSGSEGALGARSPRATRPQSMRWLLNCAMFGFEFSAERILRSKLPAEGCETRQARPEQKKRGRLGNGVDP